MANRIVIFKHQTDYQQLSDGWQLLLDGLNQFVPGSKMESVARLDALDRVLSVEKQGILIVPMVGAKHEKVARMQLELRSQMPFPFFMAIVFVLIEDNQKSLTSKNVMSHKWVETVDSFYDQAVPVQFLYCSGADADAHTFNIAASLSSLLRQLDSLAELRKLNDAVVDLESQIKKIQLGFSKP